MTGSTDRPLVEVNDDGVVTRIGDRAFEPPPANAGMESLGGRFTSAGGTPSFAAAYAQLGWIRHYEWDWEAAERAFERAIALDPGYVFAHQWYGDYLARRGRFDESVAAHTRALELDPLSLVASSTLGMGLYMARRYDESIAQLQKTLDMDANFYGAHFHLGRAYMRC